MPCFYPRTAWQNAGGGRLLWRRPHQAAGAKELQVPCQQCVGCRLRYSGQWATRCMHEAKCHVHNSWLTLTYDDEHLPQKYSTGVVHPRTGKPIYSGSLDKSHPQYFLRAMRKQVKSAIRKAFSPPPLRGARTGGEQNQTHYLADAIPSAHCARTAPHEAVAHPVRYYYAGEYGELYGRPHYHICLFGIDFSDKRLVGKTDTGFNLYESKTVGEIWPHGNHAISELSWEAAAYTARYVMKKINKNTKLQNEKHYKKLDPETGEIITLIPEYCDMSRRPGIASPWLSRNLADVYPSDEVIHRGHPTRPPRYYDKKLSELFPDMHERVKTSRQLEAHLYEEKRSHARLDAEHRITKSKIKSLKGHL